MENANRQVIATGVMVLRGERGGGGQNRNVCISKPLVLTDSFYIQEIVRESRCAGNRGLSGYGSGGGKVREERRNNQSLCGSPGERDQA